MGTPFDEHASTTNTTGPLRPRRRPVVFGRALIGGLLVSSAVIAGFVLAQPQPTPPLPTYVAAAVDIDAGDRIRVADLTTVSAALPDNSAAATTVDDIAGAIALAPIHRREIIDERDVAHDPVIGGQSVTEVHQVTVPVSPERIPPSVGRGDYVTVLAFDDERQQSVIVLERVLVLDAGGDREGLVRTAQRHLTLAVPDAASAIDMVTWSYAALDIVLTNGVLEPSDPDRRSSGTSPSEEVSR